MIKYGVKYLKNTFVPLNCPDNVNLDDGQLIIARTEKGEEVLKAFLLCKCVAKRFEDSDKTPAPFEFVRIMTQEDMMVYEELKKEEVTSFFKCKELVKKHNLNMNLVQNYRLKCPNCGFPLKYEVNKNYGLPLYICTNEPEICDFMTNSRECMKDIFKCDQCEDGYMIVKKQIENDHYFFGCTNYNSEKNCKNIIDIIC